MTPAGMKAAIKAELTAAGFNIDHPDTNGEGDAYIEAIATGVVTYIQASAQAFEAPATYLPIV